MNPCLQQLFLRLLRGEVSSALQCDLEVQLMGMERRLRVPGRPPGFVENMVIRELYFWIVSNKQAYYKEEAAYFTMAL
jgi:hypothetical protein